MKNVYDQVRSFYEHEQEWSAPVSREWIDGFLRHKAWQGADDNELKTLWRYLELFTLYLMYIDNTDIGKLEPDDYRRAVEWLERHVTGFTADKQTINRFFKALQDFYNYLATRKIYLDSSRLEYAVNFFARERRTARSGRRVARRDNRLSADEMAKLIRENGADMDHDLGRMIGETAERLMAKLGIFFQHDYFIEDLRRALFLYNGPFEAVSEEENEEFWLGFWDYFLFDYHLLANDLTPLAYFDVECGSTLAAEERMLLTQLQAAQFTVFYIHKIIGQEWVECVNLFTDERFQLPLPELGFKLLKKALFYGHIFSQDIVMVNSVTSVTVSPILRRRIKEQIIKQKNIFDIQCPQATWNEFFQRHALGVRHAINRLLNLATVNVTPFALLDKEYPEIKISRAPNRDVLTLIGKVMRDYSFSLHDIKLAHKMWEDFSQLAPVHVRKPEAWAAAVIFAYAQTNYPHGLAAGKLADDLKISSQSIYNNRKRLSQTLELEAFDPRYLSEEGLVSSLFMS